MTTKLTNQEFDKLMADGQHVIIGEYSGSISLQHAVSTDDARAAENSLRGARNRAQGASLEARIDAYHNALCASGKLAGCINTDPRIVTTSPGMARIVGAGKVDYMAFTATGECYHFDAKSTSAKQGFTIGQKAEHQLDWLRQMYAAGFPAAYLVEWIAHGVCCWHPVSTVDGKRIRYADGIRIEDVRWFELFT